jgi:hypothetical protein
MVGVLRVSYSGTYYDDKRLGVGRDLVLVMVVVLLVAAFIGIAGVITISQPMATAITRLSAGLDALRHRVGLASSRDPAPSADIRPSDIRHDSEIERSLLQAITSLERAEHLATADAAGSRRVDAS